MILSYLIKNSSKHTGSQNDEPELVGIGNRQPRHQTASLKHSELQYREFACWDMLQSKFEQMFSSMVIR